MSYVPHTESETKAMLAAIGVESLTDLFTSIPESLRLSRPLDIPARRTEAEVLRELGELAARNRDVGERPSFLGAGCYRRFIPAAVDYLASRGEFNTAYTPYQPEVSQGTLQAIFEYQSMICRLTAMEISNASMYEGATALAEAVLMSYALKRKGRRVLVSEALHPDYRGVLETYLRSHPIELETIPLDSGKTSPSELARQLDGDILAVVVQNPNFFGTIEPTEEIAAALGAKGSNARPIFIAVVDPISLALLKPPGAYGADIAVGEGQQLGNYPSYGGPSFGFFATRQSHVRKVPGRIVGETKDRSGKRGYVLTFQTREQHIRREKATSNICTNQGLCCLRGAMYLAIMGAAGLREVASSSTRKAHYALERLCRIGGVSQTFAGAPFLNEFALRLPIPAEAAYAGLAEHHIGGGLPLSRYFPEKTHDMLIALTELNTVAEIEQLAVGLEKTIQNVGRQTESPQSEKDTAESTA